MVNFVTTRAALSELENIIESATGELILLSPYVRLAPDLLDRLRAADIRGVRITLVYGKNELHETQRSAFEEFTNLSVYFSERLHAKCYYNERRMVITSLNLLTGSEHNWEMGFVLDHDEDAYRSAVHEAQRIIGQAVLRSAPRAKAPKQIDTAGESRRILHPLCPEDRT